MDITEKDAPQKVPEALKGMGIEATPDEIMAWLGGRVPEEKEEAERALRAGEMLGLTEVVNGLALDGPPVTLQMNIVCHNLERQALVRAWAMGYRLVYDGIIDFEVDSRLLLAALKKGLEPRELREQVGITDEHLKYCTRLEVLNVGECKMVTRCPVTVVELDARGNCGIGDSGLEGCDRLERLFASGNPRITRCPPTVTDLSASGDSEIGTESIMQCTSLKRLDAQGNIYITRFPHSVEILLIDRGSVISTEILTRHKNIKNLYICGNARITNLPDDLEELDMSDMEYCDECSCKNGRLDISDISSLKKLRSLDASNTCLFWYETEERLPETIEVLKISCETKIREQDLARLTRLHTLKLFNEYEIIEIPKSVTTLIINKGGYRRIVGGSIRSLSLSSVTIRGELPKTVEELEIKVTARIDKDALASCFCLKKLTIDHLYSELTALPPNLEELIITEPTHPEAKRSILFYDQDGRHELVFIPILNTPLLDSCRHLKKLTIRGGSLKYCPPSVEELVFDDKAMFTHESVSLSPNLKKVTIARSYCNRQNNHPLIRLSNNQRPVPEEVLQSSVPRDFGDLWRQIGFPESPSRVVPEANASPKMTVFEIIFGKAELPQHRAVRISRKLVVTMDFLKRELNNPLPLSVIGAEVNAKVGHIGNSGLMDATLTLALRKSDNAEVAELLSNCIYRNPPWLRSIFAEQTPDTVYSPLLQNFFAERVLDTTDLRLREVTRRFWMAYLAKKGVELPFEIPVPAVFLTKTGFDSAEIAELVDAIRNTTDQELRDLVSDTA